MGNFPQIGPPTRIPIVVPTPAYLMDHHFQGQPVLPAVEAMEALARAAEAMHPQLRAVHLTDARFEKFLFMDPGADRLDAMAELQEFENGSLQATLLTRTKARNAAFTRTKIHARVNFEPSAPVQNCPPLDMAAALEGICTTVAPQSIYSDLVPFGPAFRNIKAPLFISPDGALARIETPPPKQHSTPDGSAILGSPYALDAAFHGACVWAQHYLNIVAFPVAIDRRVVIAPTRPAKTYFGRITPKTVTAEQLSFDILLLDENGLVCEVAEGVRMRDVSGGRLAPPEWIRHGGQPDPLEHLRKACLGISIVERDTVASFAQQTLTPQEKEKYRDMGTRRRGSYLAARLALKRLYRRFMGNGQASAPSDQIETVRKNSPLPCFGRNDSHGDYHCSVSHDRRFAVAVVDAQALGVDVEVISAKALTSARIFMHACEQNLIQQSPLGDTAAAVRIWSLKEAAAKATGMNLAEAWARVRVTAVGSQQSCLSIDEREMSALHATVDDHLFTLISARIDPMHVQPLSRKWSK